MDSKIFWILVEMKIQMDINCKLRLSPTVYTNLQGYVKFKVDFHRVSIRVRKDLVQKWYHLPYLATNDAIDLVLDKWPVVWHSTKDMAVGRRKSAMYKKKEEAKLKMTQLAEKRKKEVTDKAQVECKATQQTRKKTGGTKQSSRKGMRSPSPKTEWEIEKHYMDPQETSTRIKCPREMAKGGPRKKSKVTKTSLDPITLIEGNLHDISDTLRDVTVEAIQKFQQQQQIILGAIQIGLQELQTHTSQASTVSTTLAINTSEPAKMLCVKASSAIVLPDGALTTENVTDRPTVSTVKGVGLNLVALSC